METLNHVLSRMDRADAGITFLDEGAELVSYADLAALVRGNAEHFARCGIARGDRVALALATDLEHVVTFLALVALGAVPVSVKPARGTPDAYAEDLARIFARFDVRFVHHALPAPPTTAHVAWDPHARSSNPTAVAEASTEDLAFVQFSSGSLGDPKAIPIRHGSLMHNLGAITAVDRRTPESIGYNFLPLSHDMGLVGGLLSNLVLQNPLYLSTVQLFLRRPAAFFMDHPRCDVVGMPDFAIRHLIRYLDARKRSDPRVLAGLGTIFCGAEPIRHATMSAVVASATKYGFDPRALVFCYGMAEATLMVTAHRFSSIEESFFADGNGRHVANVGRPVPGTEVVARVRGESGYANAEEEAEGELFVRGPGVFAGYLDGERPEDGWHATGDVGFVRNGNVYVSGRVKDMIIVNGENLFPNDIESFISRLPGVGESLVMADDDRFHVFLVARPDVDTGAVAGHVAARFGAAPRSIVLGPSRDILRTTSGKPMRQAMLVELRKRGAVAC